MEGPFRRHRALYKGSPAPPWKEAFRQRCVERLKGSRDRLLERHRNAGGNASLVQEAMEAEWGLQRTIGAWDEALEDSELAVLEEIQRELLLQEQQRAAEEYEQSLRLDEESLEAALEGLEAGHRVICPLCRRHTLGVTSRLVACACGLHLATQEMTEEKLRSMLDEAMREHSQCCQGGPAFAATGGMEGGGANLLMSCQVCDSWAVIL